jgi:hypothetical protein
MPALRIDRERFSYVPSARKTAVRSTEHSVTVDCEDQDELELEVTDLAVCSSLGTQRMTLVLIPVHGHRCRRHDIPSHELSTIIVSHARRQGTSVYMHPSLLRTIGCTCRSSALPPTNGPSMTLYGKSPAGGSPRTSTSAWESGRGPPARVRTRTMMHHRDTDKPLLLSASPLSGICAAAQSLRTVRPVPPRRRVQPVCRRVLRGVGPEQQDGDAV